MLFRVILTGYETFLHIEMQFVRAKYHQEIEAWKIIQTDVGYYAHYN